MRDSYLVFCLSCNKFNKIFPLDVFSISNVMHVTVHHQVEAKIQLKVSSSWYTHYYWTTASETNFEKKFQSPCLKSSSQKMHDTDTFILKHSSNLLMWRRNVYDVTDVERRTDARGYISALTEYNFSLLGYLYSVDVRGSYRIKEFMVSFPIVCKIFFLCYIHCIEMWNGWFYIFMYLSFRQEVF